MQSRNHAICLKEAGRLLHLRIHHTLSTTTHPAPSFRRSSTARKMAAPTTCTLSTTGNLTPATYQGKSVRYHFPLTTEARDFTVVCCNQFHKFR
ncbi:hypothetical protein C2S52_012090 [Perilla frutescens var. hirtella]|nr:hypothetical protein C2S52_012090 [Perilla frutescens var. hirtella]KAH6785318.1 hypothetical protein C2S51_037773 [Perilla frutescens var. frutescens]